MPDADVAAPPVNPPPTGLVVEKAAVKLPELFVTDSVKLSSNATPVRSAVPVPFPAAMPAPFQMPAPAARSCSEPLSVNVAQPPSS